MRNLCLIVLFSIVLFSCNGEKKYGKPNYLKDSVGKVENGKFIVTNAEAIKAAWTSMPGNAEEFYSFDIVHGLTQGDAEEEYYLLLSKNKGGDVKTAAMLVLRDNKFYFEEPAEISAYIRITCSGECTDDCNPVVKISEGNRYLLCSSCPECRKVEREMN